MALTPSPARTLTVPRRDATPRGFVPAPMPLRWPNKAPGDTLEYTIDLAQLLDTTDTLSSASAAVSPSVSGGLASDDVTVDDTSVTLWLSDGVDGVDYEVQLTASSEAGRVIQVNIAVYVEDLTAV